jgi:NADH-quinone oxidoreductase subunit N
VIALLNTVVSLYYYIKVLKNMYLVRPETELPKFSLSPASFAMLMVLLIPILVFGVYFTPLVNFAKNSIGLMGF